MSPNLDLRSDKNIIIGFTGPIGSGCTELSRFIADNDSFRAFLQKSGFTTYQEDNKLRTDIFDEEIKGKFEKINTLGKNLDGIEQKIGTDNSGSLPLKAERIRYDLRCQHKMAKTLLEKRKYIYSLEYLLDEKYYNKKLRISCSSIIVFELLRNLTNDIKGATEENKRKTVEIRGLISKQLEDNNITPSFFSNIYLSLRGLHSHASASGIDDIKGEDVKKCFDSIALIKKGLKDNRHYRELMQDFGDNLRSSGDPYHYPDPKWIEEHKDEFQSNNCIIGRYIDYLVHYYSIAENTRLFVIDSLRNPMCIKYLRNRYPKFFLISLYSSFDNRLARLKKLDISIQKKEFADQDYRDQGKSFDNVYDGFYKQNVRESALSSDISINNDEEFYKDLSDKVKKETSAIFRTLLRYLTLILNPGCTKPTAEEMFMNMAYTMAMKSNCISRKVGAVIEGANGYVVGAGWNDVGQGQISCGLRKIKDLRIDEYSNYPKSIIKKRGLDTISDEDVITGLIKKYGNDNCCFCMKDELSKAEQSREIDKIFNVKDQAVNKNEKDVYNRINNKLKIKRLEYCKALHAEENAIIQSAKIGGMGLNNASMYVTTYPCELCAKKIQQAGIKEVVYVEPYPKVLSEELYLSDGIQKVKIRQFEGVKAYGYMKLFRSAIDQKERQVLEHKGFLQNL